MTRTIPRNSLIPHSATNCLKCLFLLVTMLTMTACGSGGDSNGTTGGTTGMQETTIAGGTTTADGTTSAGDTTGSEETTDGNELDSEDGTTTVAKLLGEWVICLGSPSQTMLGTYTFTENRWTLARQDHSNGDCSGSPFFVAGVSGGSFEVVGDSTSESGLSVKQINLTKDNIDGDPLGETEQSTTYGIFYTGVPDQLHIATAAFEEDRPTALDFEFFYTRP